MYTLWNQMIFLIQALGVCICFETVVYLTATSNPQYFTSVNYPSDYYSYSNYKWRIRAQNSSDVIRIDVVDCSIESHSSCYYDGVSVYDGNLSPDNRPYRSQKLATFCGHKTPSYLSTGEYMSIWFYSDYSYEYRGFKIKYYSGSAADLKIEEEDEEESSNLGLVIGGVVGGILTLGVIAACIGCCVSHSKKTGRSVVPANRVNINSLSNRYNDSYNAQLFSSTFVPPPPYSRYEENSRRNLAPVGTTNMRDVRPDRHPEQHDRNTTDSATNSGGRVSIGIASSVVPPDAVNPPSSRMLPSAPPADTVPPETMADNEPVPYQYEPFPLPLSPPPPYTPTPPQTFQPPEQESRV